MRLARGILAVAVLLLSAGQAVAQGVTTVRALRATAVLAEPQGSADAVGTVNAGDVLEVLDQREGWYLVRPPVGVSQTWRTGWINGASVTPVGAAPPPSPSTARATSPAVGDSRSANRKGFLFGLGGGAGTHRAPISRFFEAGTTSELAIITDLSLGYAPTDQVLIYYSNQVAWSRSTQYDVVGVTGVGVTYMMSRSSPSPFVRGSIGGGIVADVDYVSGGVSSNNTGLGLTLGGGYEFARHWSVEGGAMFVRASNGNNHTVLKATFNWLFY